jgi:hypothetical protein
MVTPNLDGTIPSISQRISLLGQEFLSERLAKPEANLEAIKATSTRMKTLELTDMAERIVEHFSKNGHPPNSNWTFRVELDRSQIQAIKGQRGSLSVNTNKEEKMLAVEQTADELYARLRDVSPEVKPVAVRKATGIVRESQDPHEIAYYTHLFSSHISEWKPNITSRFTEPYQLELYNAGRELARTAAANPNIAEKTQLLLAKESIYARDPKIQHALAHNPGLKPSAMRQMLTNPVVRDDAIRLPLVLNAIRQSHQSHSRLNTAFSAICEEIANSNTEPSLAIQAKAIQGIRSESSLRALTERSINTHQIRALANLAKNPLLPADAASAILAHPLSRVMVGKESHIDLQQKIAREIGRHSQVNESPSPT